MSSVRIEQQCVASKTPSAKLIYLILQHEGQLTKSELLEKTMLSRSTVHTGIDQLLSCEVIEKQTGLQDARERLYIPITPY